MMWSVLLGRLCHGAGAEKRGSRKEQGREQEQEQEQWQEQAQTQAREWEVGRWPFSVPGRVMAATR